MTAAAELCALSAHELLAAYRERALSPLEVVDALLARIVEVDTELGAFVTLCPERARAEALASERAYLSGRAEGALAGVPFAVKDLFDSAQVRTTYGSTMFASSTPGADAAAVRRVREAGAVMLGKTQTHEFAWGVTSVNERMGTSHNPWRPDRVSGGSSGGSAVALAARLVPLAIGSDTGGSIRVPSAFCGTAGLKATYGRISMEGAWPLAPTLDHAGPMARTPADAALLLDVMGGGSSPPPPRALPELRLGICPDLHRVPPAPEVQAAFDNAARTVADLGARVVEVGLEGAETIFPAFGVIQRAEAVRTHRDAGLYPKRREEYGNDVRGRLEAAERVTLDDYLAAASTREHVRAAVAALFERVDLLLTPISAGSPPPIGEESVVHGGHEIDFRELVMTYTAPQNLLGLPACAVRAGFDALGIPIGVQFTGRQWADHEVLAVAEAFYEATPAVQDRWPIAPAVEWGAPGPGAPSIP